MGFQEKMLGMICVGATSPTSIYSPAIGVDTIVKQIVACNNTYATATYSIFFCDTGTTYNRSTALVFECQLPAHNQVFFNGFFPMSNATGNIAGRSSVASAVTFSCFGVELS
jgi:hypothetical protein